MADTFTRTLWPMNRAGTLFGDKHQLARDLARTLMTIEQVPDIPMFRQNTAAFVHELPADSLSNVDGDGTYVRVQVLTNAGALDRDKQLAVVRQLTDLIAAAAGDPSLTGRTWVLLTEAPDGGWGLASHANTNAELVTAARAQVAELSAGGPASVAHLAVRFARWLPWTAAAAREAGLRSLHGRNLGALSLAKRTESSPVADHSIRSFLFARLLASQQGSAGDDAYDENLLFAACIMHDLGLGTSADGKQRFEVEGADLAADLLRRHGVPTADVDRVWEAIALHSSIGIAGRLGLLTYLAHRGVFTDAGVFTDLPEGLRRQVLAVYPRPAGDSYIRDAIVAHAKRSKTAAPPYSIAAELLRQELTR